MTPRNCTVGNYQLEKLDDKWMLHYVGDGWETVTRTEKQVVEAKTFFELWNN